MRDGDKTPIPFQHDDACYVEYHGDAILSVAILIQKQAWKYAKPPKCEFLTIPNYY